MSVCRHELGGGSTPQPPGNSNPGAATHTLATLLLQTTFLLSLMASGFGMKI